VVPFFDVVDAFVEGVQRSFGCREIATAESFEELVKPR